MEYIYAVGSEDELLRLRRLTAGFERRIEAYIDCLRQDFGVRELPRAVVWTSRGIACGLLSDIPVPAYTNDYRVMFEPDLAVWREIYLRQLDAYPPESAAPTREYYGSELSERHVLQILGHELAHHSDWFSDEAYDNGGAWFEEGMVEYISRKYFLTAQEFERQTEINRLLVRLYEETHGERPLSDFGKLADREDYATLYYDYWRAFLRVRDLIDDHGGDAPAVLREYGQGVEHSLAPG